MGLLYIHCAIDWHIIRPITQPKISKNLQQYKTSNKKSDDLTQNNVNRLTGVALEVDLRVHCACLNKWVGQPTLNLTIRDVMGSVNRHII